MSWVREQFGDRYRAVKLKSSKDAILRAGIHGAILGIAIFYPAAIWKRIVGAILAFFLVGVVAQFWAIRRERAARGGSAELRSVYLDFRNPRDRINQADSLHTYDRAKDG